MERLSLVHVGYKFHPTDEELVHHYLPLKASGYDNDVSFIPEVDVCNKEPWDLPDLSVTESIDDEWFFFCPNKYRNRKRLIRATIAGYWKSTGKEKTIKSTKGNRVIGKKKAFVFYIGRVPKGERTNWVIHEYCATENELDFTHPGQSRFVLCRLFKKGNDKNETSGCSKFVYDNQDVTCIKSFIEDPPLEPLTPILASAIEDHNVESVEHMDFQQDEVCDPIHSQTHLLEFGSSFLGNPTMPNSINDHNVKGIMEFSGHVLNEPDHFHFKDTDKDTRVAHDSMQEDNNDKVTDSNQDHLMNLISNKESLEEKSNVTEVDHFPSDHDHLSSKNGDISGTGIIIRRRTKKEFIKLPFQGTANRRMGSALGKMRFLNRNRLNNLGSNEETREEVVDRYLIEDTGDTEAMQVDCVPFDVNNDSETARTRQNLMPAALLFQGTANRRIRLQRKLQGGPSIKQGEPSNLGTNEETLQGKSSMTEAETLLDDQDSSSSVVQAKETSLFSRAKAALTLIPMVLRMPKVVVVMGFLCVGVVALWKGRNVL